MATLRARSEVGSVTALLTVIFYGIYMMLPAGFWSYLLESIRHSSH